MLNGEENVDWLEQLRRGQVASIRSIYKPGIPVASALNGQNLVTSNDDHHRIMMIRIIKWKQVSERIEPMMMLMNEWMNCAR